MTCNSGGNIHTDTVYCASVQEAARNATCQISFWKVFVTKTHIGLGILNHLF